MSDTIDRNAFNRLKQRHAVAQQRKAEAVGALKPMYDRLLTEFGCATLEEARTRLTALEMQQTKKLKMYQTLFDEYKEQYGEGE